MQTNIKRISILQTTGAVILIVVCLTIELRAQAILVEDAPHTHNMLAVGENTVFLSHLPMFDAVSQERPTYTSPHRFQVILQAKLTDGNNSLQDVYSADRKDNPSTRIYTLRPKTFVLTRLVAPGPQPRPLNSFEGTVFRGHLEKGGESIIGLEEIDVNIERVVYFREFDAKQKRASQLEYLLFGKGEEFFLAHLISAPPDFDQVLSVKILGHSFTDEELSRGVRVLFQDRKNIATQRIKANDKARAQFHVTGADQSLDLQVQAGIEYYFEEGELAVPPIFPEQTSEERKAGF